MKLINNTYKQKRITTAKLINLLNMRISGEVGSKQDIIIMQTALQTSIRCLMQEVKYTYRSQAWPLPLPLYTNMYQSRLLVKKERGCFKGDMSTLNWTDATVHMKGRHVSKLRTHYSAGDHAKRNGNRKGHES